MLPAILVRCGVLQVTVCSVTRKPMLNTDIRGRVVWTVGVSPQGEEDPSEKPRKKRITNKKESR